MTIAANAVSPADIIVLCDEDDDRSLFLAIKSIHPLLANIPVENVKTYDQARSTRTRTALEEVVAPLHQDDRPDWIFCHNDKPVLVTELTKHAYTGDNGLQRFARFAAAAECKVPFIYFGPLKRVRDDELDGGRNASPRRLTSDLFVGMQSLSRVLNVPQIYVEWITDGSGLPSSLPFRATQQDIVHLYGKLLKRISDILFIAPLCTQGDPLSSPEIASAQKETEILSMELNTRDSDVRFDFSHVKLARLLETPAYMLDEMAPTRYFRKGKPDKGLAEYALLNAGITAIQHCDGRIEKLSVARRTEVIKNLLALPRFQNRTTVYYTGYKWRPDPHCGVLVNLDYRLCRAPGENSPKDRTTGLVVVYPRISLLPREGLGAQLSQLSLSNPGRLRDVFRSRYASLAEAKMRACLSTDDLFSGWSNSTKQARLFRRYSDIIILNDAIILGDSLSDLTV